jgi:excisionase family DNA binding protein
MDSKKGGKMLALEAGTLMTVREASELLHVASNTLRRWSDVGIIKAYRIGTRGDRRFHLEDVIALLEKDSNGRGAPNM